MEKRLDATAERVLTERQWRCRSRVRDTRPDLHSGLRHAALSAYSRAFRLRENCRGLQSSLQFLRDSANARQTPQPHAGNRCWRKFGRLVSEGVHEINLISQDTTYYGMDLWDGESRTASAGRFCSRTDSGRAASRNSSRSKANSGCACFTRIRRTGATN